MHLGVLFMFCNCLIEVKYYFSWPLSLVHLISNRFSLGSAACKDSLTGMVVLECLYLGVKAALVLRSSRPDRTQPQREHGPSAEHPDVSWGGGHGGFAGIFVVQSHTERRFYSEFVADTSGLNVQWSLLHGRAERRVRAALGTCWRSSITDHIPVSLFVIRSSPRERASFHSHQPNHPNRERALLQWKQLKHVPQLHFSAQSGMFFLFGWITYC